MLNISMPKLLDDFTAKRTKKKMMNESKKK